MAERQLIVAVEGTAAMGPFWPTVVSDYLEKIIRSFCGTELTGQKLSTPNVELALVTFCAHGSYCACLVQRSGWTRDIDVFLQWLSAMPFGGGGFSDAAIAEGLSEALMMFPPTPGGSQAQQINEFPRHCILVAASNPYPLPTPVYRPQVQNLEQDEKIEAQNENRLSDAETLAKSFSQCFVSLSVICPKQLPKLRAIYNAGKRNQHAPEAPVDSVKNPHFLVLISENFTEARAALSRPGVTNLASNQSPVKMDIASVNSAPGPPPTVIPSANGSVMNRLPTSGGTITTATVKVEPSTVTSMPSQPTFPQVQSISRTAIPVVPSLQTSSPSSASPEIINNGENMHEVKPSVSGIMQSVRNVPPGAANVSILNNLSQARVSAALTGGNSIGLQSIGQTPVAMHMSNMISSGMTSSMPPSQSTFSSGQSTGASIITQVPQNSGHNSLTSATTNMPGNSNTAQPIGNIQGAVGQGNISGGQVMQNTISMNQNMTSVASGTGMMIPTPGMSQQGQPATQSLSGGNNSAVNMPLSQQAGSTLQSAQTKYIRVWEGNLSGQRQGQPVFITRLEGYRNFSASENLAANWPPTMQIVRLISQDHMNNKQYVGKADFLVFRALNQHGFLAQLQEKKLCAVIQLPSQTLLLSVSDKAFRLIGMLFPGDMVVFKPQIPSNQQQQMQPQQHPQLHQLQQQQLQQQQQQQQQHQQLSQLQQQQPLQQQQQQQPLQQLQQQQQPLQQLQQQQQPIQQMQQQQQQPIQQMQQQQQQPIQQLQQQQQQQIPQQQQMMGTGLAQPFNNQSSGRSQMISQGQVSSQGPSNNMPGGGAGFMS